MGSMCSRQVCTIGFAQGCGELLLDEVLCFVVGCIDVSDILSEHAVSACGVLHATR